MARSERTVVLEHRVEPDGQVVVFTQLEVWEGGFTTGVQVAAGPRTGRKIDVGDDVSGEDQVTQDIVNGNLHSQARIDARDVADPSRND